MLQVVHVVGGHMATEVTHGHATPLLVLTRPRPLLGTRPVEHPEVGLAQQPEHGESLAGPLEVIASEHGPAILIEAAEDRVVLLEHLAIPKKS